MIYHIISGYYSFKCNFRDEYFDMNPALCAARLKFLSKVCIHFDEGCDSPLTPLYRALSEYLSCIEFDHEINKVLLLLLSTGRRSTEFSNS